MAGEALGGVDEGEGVSAGAAPHIVRIKAGQKWRRISLS